MRLFTKIVVSLSLLYCSSILVATKLMRLEPREELLPQSFSSPIFLLRPPYGGFLATLLVIFATRVRRGRYELKCAGLLLMLTVGQATAQFAPMEKARAWKDWAEMPARKFINAILFDTCYDLVRDVCAMVAAWWNGDDISDHVGDIDLEAGIVLLNIVEIAFE